MPEKTNEDYRRASLLLGSAAREGRYKSVIFCSTAKGEGTTTAVLNIARELSKDHELRILIVELNWRRPVYAEMFNLDKEKSVAAVAAGTICARQCVQVDSSGLALLPAGEDSPEIRGKGGVAAVLRRILQDVESEFDIVLLDMPPVLETVDVIAAGAVVPRVVLIVEAGQARYEVLERVKEEFASENITILGAILNKQRQFIPNWAYRWLVR